MAAARCADYEFETVRAALREVLAPLGGMAAFVKPGERIALKPNLLSPAPPERAVVTHPVVLAAVAVEVMEAGAHPVVVESPGTGVIHAKPVIERVFRKVGYVEMAERYGFELSFDTAWDNVSAPDAKVAKRLEVMSPIVRADGVINLPKFKTHMFMIFTGATKNLFGVIPGLNKASLHARMPDPHQFADMLLDVAYFVNPRLSIVDAILGMEGDGPGTGGSASLHRGAGGRRGPSSRGCGLLPHSEHPGGGRAGAHGCSRAAAVERPCGRRGYPGRVDRRPARGGLRAAG